MRDAEQRAAERPRWPVRVHRGRVGAHDPADGVASAPEQRLAMMWELAVQAWTLAGRELPSYERHEMPVRVIRGVDFT